jgi:hypothetical protein
MSRARLRLLLGLAAWAGGGLRAQTEGAGDPPGRAADATSFLEEESGLAFDAGLRQGLILRPPGEWELHLGGVLAADTLHLDDRNRRSSGPFLDRVVPRLDATWRELQIRIAPDLRGIDTRGGFDEAWASWEPGPLLRLSSGLIEIPLTHEHTIPEEELPVVGYGFGPQLAGRSDLAARVEGELREGLLSWDLSAAAGEGFARTGHRSAGPRLSAMLTVFPLRELGWRLEAGPYEIPLLSGFFLTGAYQRGQDLSTRLEVTHPFRDELFVTPRFEANSSDFFHAGIGFDLGPFLYVHEIVRGGYNGLELPGGGERDLRGQVTSWSALAAWMISGEPYDSRPFRRRYGRREPFPRKPAWGPRGQEGFGALELALRYNNGDIDRRFFDVGFTDYTTSSQEFRAFAVGLNWYPMRCLRLTAEVVRTLADNRPQAFDSHGRDTSALLRVQWTF